MKDASFLLRHFSVLLFVGCSNAEKEEEKTAPFACEVRQEE